MFFVAFACSWCLCFGDWVRAQDKRVCRWNGNEGELGKGIEQISAYGIFSHNWDEGVEDGASGVALKVFWFVVHRIKVMGPVCKLYKTWIQKAGATDTVFLRDSASEELSSRVLAAYLRFVRFVVSGKASIKALKFE